MCKHRVWSVMICARWTCLFCAPNSTLQLSVGRKNFLHLCIFFIVHTALMFWKFCFLCLRTKMKLPFSETVLMGFAAHQKVSRKVTPCSTIYTETKKKRRISFFVFWFFLRHFEQRWIFYLRRETYWFYGSTGKRTGPTAQGNVLDPQGTTGNRFL